MSKITRVSGAAGWINPEFKKGLVSVVVPTHNHAAMITEALESVWQQSYRPIELIVVNDGSTDKTEKVVKKWVDSHQSDGDFIAKYVYQENSGVCAARNLALKNSEGEFIQFLDSDDLIHQERLEKVVALFNEENVDYVETGFEGFFKSRGDSDEIHYGHVEKDQIALLLQGTLWPNTLRPTYRRSLISHTGPWNESMVTLQDYEYVIRALVRMPKPKTGSIRDVLASARRDHGPRMSDIIKTREGRTLRIHCERILCERANECDYITDDLKRDLASRLFALGFRSNASGWPDLGNKCAELAESLNVKLDMLGLRRKFIFKAGPVAARVYSWAHQLKTNLAR